MLSCDSETTVTRINQAERLQLFLDYDGTLADFAPSPDHVLPDEEVIGILRGLKTNPAIRVAVVSGRRLSHVQKLLPIEGILLAGTYGIEQLTPKGEVFNRLDYEHIRPQLEALKPQWKVHIGDEDGFYLEDKGWSLAIHARFADEHKAEKVLQSAGEIAQRWIGADEFRLLGGDRFLEAAPKIANKGETIAYLLEHYPWEGSLPIYVGDDDKDEEAFAAINSRGGISIVVAREARPTQAGCRLDSPQEVRRKTC
jgi:trehalose 6-phosphate phosphatase